MKLALVSTSGAPPPNNTDCFIFVSTNYGSTWIQTSASTNESWQAIASSADGERLVAVSGFNGSIYISPDGGLTWNVTSAPNTNWYCVASSADGTKLVAGVGKPYRSYAPFGPVYVSTNSGTTWLPSSGPIQYWCALASSADGNKVVAAALDSTNSSNGGLIGHIYISSDSGFTWRQTTAPGSNVWSSVCSSADGRRLAASSAQEFPNTFGCVFTSPDGGTTWTRSITPNDMWGAIISDATGTNLMLFSGANGKSYRSADSGTGWLQMVRPTISSQYAACSADGNRVTTVSGPWSGLITTGCFPPMPTLSYWQTSSNLTLSWTVPSSTAVLQVSSDLNTTNWLDVTNPPVCNLTNLQNQLTLPTSVANSYFRLRTQ